ncbi:Apoptosis-stimulating of p53 protein 1 [Plakobranchus ocellatus]|uniref:Apoptosis-stimulating of p53 protein 1 n=1 Tax=Plakobranchus ocellatus TaxID=259542 RepID=A0AAV4CU04_9GAST|nr:Apoptosis-stimulating of p53 protein 1 [Plakobranchus ocellatus]
MQNQSNQATFDTVVGCTAEPASSSGCIMRSLMPGGSGDLTLAELQEMASRQQQQMEAQQQVLVAKEQRLKYLRQQEARHAQLATEGERIRKMRERVESQELKLKKLRALRGQAEQYRANNNSLNGELDAVKAVFNEKEKELAMAVARVDRLNRQLQDLRSGSNGGAQDNKQSAVAVELEKLRKELLIRNKLNEQQSNTISAKEKMLNQRREEVARMDARIRELQQRLKKRQAQELQMKQQQEQKRDPGTRSNQRNDTSNSYNNAPGRNVATVEPYIQYAPQQVAKDDLYSKTFGGNFLKQDPKYQTLPARVKPVPHSVDSSSGGRGTKPVEMNNNSEVIEEYQLPTVLPGEANTRLNEQESNQRNTTPAGRVPDTLAGRNHHHIPEQPGQVTYENVAGPLLQLKPVPKPGSVSQESVYFPEGNKTQQQQLSHPAFAGAGDGVSYRKPVGSLPLNPVINIEEEERQAGSGQSSPASSEASTSSGGIQVKTDSEVNTSPIGPVSAMIERLNRTGLTQQQPGPHSQDRSVFTQRNGQSSQDSKQPATKLVGISQPSSSTAAAAATTATEAPDHAGSGRHYSQLQQPPDSQQTLKASSSGLDDVDFTKRGNIVQQPSFGYPLPTSSSAAASTTSTGPHLNQKPAPTYRYASKSQIANTYMGRLGSAVMDKYQRNLNQIYKNLDSNLGQGFGGAGQVGDMQVGEAKTSFSQSSVGGTDPTEVTTTDQARHHPQFGVVSSPNYPDIASDKGSFKLNTPKQVRRRHSDSENEEMNKALQERQEFEQQEKQRQQQEQQHQLQKQPSSDKTVADVSALPQPPVKPEPQTVAVKTTTKLSDDVKDGESFNPSEERSSSDKLSHQNSGSSISVATSSLNKTNSTEASSKLSKDPEDKTKSSSKAEAVVQRTKSNLKKEGSRKSNNRVSFDPLALLLDASLEGELDLVRKVAVQVDDVSTPNDEGITALHNAICAGHYEIVKVLVEFGCDVNSPDSDGWTPLHCAASCNNLPMVRFLVEHGACVFATTISDQETAADKCEEEEDGYDGCSDYLYSIQEKLGITNSGEVYAVFDYQATKTDELSFQIGDKLTVLRKGDDTEKEWWWARLNGKEGYIPRNLLGLHPRVIPGPKEVSNC